MIYLLPGMGATSKMYQGAWSGLNPAICIDWPPYEGEASLSEWAGKVAAHYPIQDNDTLIGSSMGGMVALEIAKRLRLDRVVLVGSAIDVSEMNSLLTLLTPFVNAAPVEFFQKLAARQDGLFQQMFAASDPGFMRAMCKAISTWDGYPGELTRVTRIHGEKDKVIKCPRDCHVIKRAGHLLPITHARACVEIIRRSIQPGRSPTNGRIIWK
jgi:pimeloyl-ACP methyl ester carboxylesterase